MVQRRLNDIHGLRELIGIVSPFPFPTQLFSRTISHQPILVLLGSRGWEWGSCVSQKGDEAAPGSELMG